MGADPRHLCLPTLLALLLASGLLIDAYSLKERILARRQSSENEKEATTTQKSTQENGPNQQSPDFRLYPDLPQPPSGFLPSGPQFVPNQPPTQFVPFGPRLPSHNRFHEPSFMPRPMSSSERQQSQTFVHGLGQRLLSMIGIKPNNETADAESNNRQQPPMMQSVPGQETVRALHNATVLQQLNKGVHSIYGSLSKMYNDTVRQQLNLLQERFKKESENSTNPWQQHMAQQVPQFFKSMAARVDMAQENLNKLWNEVTQAQNRSINWAQSVPNQNSQPRTFFGSFDHFMGNPQDGSGFFDQFGRQFVGAPPANGQADGGTPDLATKMRYFWHNQVQPQIGNLRGQVMRAWRDLTQSGALAPGQSLTRRHNNDNLGNSQSNSSSDLVDNILKEIDMSSHEYALLDAKGDQQQPVQQSKRQNPPNMLGSQMNDGLMAMQRELNQLWMGLSNTLQNAIGNVKNTLNPRQTQMFGPSTLDAPNVMRREPDPAENEINGKIKDLSEVQKEADAVYNVVQQQRQQNSQPRPTFTDRFLTFFNHVDFNQVDQLPARFSDTVNRFGTVVNDLWHQIPERWDNMIHRLDQQQPAMLNSRMAAQSTTPSKPIR